MESNFDETPFDIDWDAEPIDHGPADFGEPFGGGYGDDFGGFDDF